MTLHTFHNDDGVIHHQTNRKHQTKKRKCINGKPEKREEHERAYKRNRHGKERYQRRTPTLKKEKNNDNDQDQRDYKGFNDFLDSLRHGKSRVEGNGEINVLGETFFHLRHQLLDTGRRVDCIGSRQLIRRNDSAGFPIEASGDTVILRAQFDASKVAYSYSRAVRRFADNNVAEFFWRDQAPLRENSVGIFLAFGSRLASGFAGGVHGVLCLNCVDDLRHSNTEL